MVLKQPVGAQVHGINNSPTRRHPQHRTPQVGPQPHGSGL